MKTIPDRISTLQFLIAYIKKLHQMPVKHYHLFKMLYISHKKFWSWGKIIEQAAHNFPDNIALKGNRELTYREFNEEANRIAQYLLSIGIKPGNAIPVMMKNCVEFPVVVTAIGKIGAVASLIPTSLKGKSLETVLRYADYPLAIISRAFKSQEIIFQNIQSKAQIHTVEGDEGLFKSAELFSCDNLSETNKVKTSSPFCYIFTSGTTGKGLKAAVIPHQRVIRSSIWFGKIILNSKPSDTIYSPLPFYHSSSLKMGWPVAVAGGASFVLDENFSVSQFFQCVKKWNITVLIYVGEILTYLFQLPPSENDKNHKIRRILGNGLRVEIWDKLKQRFGFREVYEMYGSSESPQTFSNILNLNYTIGANLEPFTIVQTDPETDEIKLKKSGRATPVKPGDQGLLLVKVPNRKKFSGGYLDDIQTEEKFIHSVIKEGDCWFNTGDIVQNLGFRHARFIDRIGDTYRWKGVNGSTREVESIIYNQENVNQVIVFGIKIPDHDGRAGMAVIDSSNFKDLQKQLESSFTENLPSEIVPRFIRKVESIGTTDSFKSQKKIFQNEGADPTQIDDELFVWNGKEKRYIGLTVDLYSDICEGRFRI